MSAGEAIADVKVHSQDDPSQPNEELPAIIEKSEDLSILDFTSEASLEQDDATNGAVQLSLKTLSVLDSAPPTLRSQSSSQAATFVRQKKGWTLKDRHRLKNSLLAGVGLLELGNAGDFAANVWNQIPIPHFVMALMAVGATLALAISIFALRDALLSRENIRNLREERRFLWTQKSELEAEISRALDSQLDVNFRELSTEYVERLGMDITMGFGAIMVGIGTFLAIGGANPRVFRASNLLSGYIGNAPVALFGLGNTGFSVYVWRRAHRHSAAAEKEIKSAAFRRRICRVKTYAAINAVMGVTAGAASLVTATRWEGYPVLIPCIVLSMVSNYLWRNKIGYERPLIRQRLDIDKSFLVGELEHITSTREVFRKADPSEWFTKTVPNPESLASILGFLRDNDLFDDFCKFLLKDVPLVTAILGPLGYEATIDEQSLLEADKELHTKMMKTAEDTLRSMGPIRFNYRERHCLEALGCYLCSTGVVIAKEKC